MSTTVSGHSGMNGLFSVANGGSVGPKGAGNSVAESGAVPDSPAVGVGWAAPTGVADSPGQAENDVRPEPLVSVFPVIQPLQSNESGPKCPEPSGVGMNLGNEGLQQGPIRGVCDHMTPGMPCLCQAILTANLAAKALEVGDKSAALLIQDPGSSEGTEPQWKCPASSGGVQDESTPKIYFLVLNETHQGLSGAGRSGIVSNGLSVQEPSPCARIREAIAKYSEHSEGVK